MRIVGFAGSLRKGSYNKMLLANAAEIARGQGAEAELIDLGNPEIPLYNWDVEQQGFPESVRMFREKIASADAIIIAAPEYNHSISGVLKNAVDWASREPNAFKGKVAAVMGASDGGFGTVRMQPELREVLRQLDCWVIPAPDVAISRAQDAFGEDGKFKDQKQAEKLGKLVARLIDSAKRLA